MGAFTRARLTLNLLRPWGEAGVRAKNLSEFTALSWSIKNMVKRI